jgi:hypothetical protein
MAVGLFSFGLYAWDTNHIPYRKIRAVLWWVAALLFVASAGAWVWNGINQGQSAYGTWTQSMGWLRVGLPGTVALIQTVLGYRQNRMDRAQLVTTQMEYRSDPFLRVV